MSLLSENLLFGLWWPRVANANLKCPTEVQRPTTVHSAGHGDVNLREHFGFISDKVSTCVCWEEISYSRARFLIPGYRFTVTRSRTVQVRGIILLPFGKDGLGFLDSVREMWALQEGLLYDV